MEYVDILDVYSLCTKDACIVSITVCIDNDISVINGTSVRHPLDKPNEKLATMIAYARAYQNLANKLTKRANGRIKHVDDMRLANQLQHSVISEERLSVSSSEFSHSLSKDQKSTFNDSDFLFEVSNLNSQTKKKKSRFRKDSNS